MESAEREGFLRSLWRRVRGWLLGVESVSDVKRPVAERVNVEVSNVEEVQRGARVVGIQLEDDFRRRIAEPVRATRLELANLSFFQDTAWDLHPRVNVMLGSNGYGKSLMLRTLAAMLQRRDDVTADLVEGAGPSARIRLTLSRNGVDEAIVRDHEVFLEGSASKVPLLAIPDSRFTDRSTTVAADPTTQNLALDGAVAFLEQQPYQSTIDGLLAGLALEYWLAGNRFDIPAFAQLTDVLGRLTNGEFAFHEVRRLGRTGSEIMVRTEGMARPLPIKASSQGTLSVVTIFGLIQAFLHDVASAGGQESDPQAIVMIDEVDAHLHPSWQQRIRHLLIESFPTVQFVLSSHSPLVVAGCGPGEVAVLRRGKEGRGFRIEQLEDDFLGATSPDLYADLFEIEDRDVEFRRYANREDRGELDEIRGQIDALYAKQRDRPLKDDEARKLSELLQEANVIARVAKVREAEREAEQRALDLELQVAQLQRRVAELESAPREDTVA